LLYKTALCNSTVELDDKIIAQMTHEPRTLQVAHSTAGLPEDDTSIGLKDPLIVP
jgi:hypothetical protein